MEIDQFLFKHLNFNKIAVIFLDSDEKNSGFDIFILKKKKKVVSIEKAMTGVEELAPMHDQLKNIPIFLTIYGEKLVERILENETANKFNSTSGNELLTHAVELNDGKKYLTIIKKNLLDGLIDKVRSKDLKIYGISFSIFSLLDHLNLFQEQDFCIPLGGKCFVVEKQNLKVIQKDVTNSNQEFHFFNEKRKIKEIIALSTGINFYINEPVSLINNETIKLDSKRINYNRIYQSVSQKLLFLLFAFLVINVLVDQYIGKKLLELDQYVSTQEKSIDQIEEFNKIRSLKKQLPILTNSDRQFPLCYLVNELAYYSDECIKINYLEINPITKKIKANEAIEMETNLLQLKGEISQTEGFSDFITKLDSADWVKNISKKNYYWSPEKKVAEIELQIQINE